MTTVVVITGLGQVLGDTGPRQAASVDLSSSPTLRQVEPGSPAIFTLDVKNLGSSQDVFTLDITVVPKNWTALFTDTTVEVWPGETESVSLTIRPSSDALASTEDFTVTATSELDSSWHSVDIKVGVKQVFRLDLSVSQVSTVSAGGSTDYTVTVVNEGNGQDEVSLSIVPLGETASWAQTYTKKVDLGPGMREVHSQTISVPSDTGAGAYSFLVRARSSGAGVDESKELVLDVKGAPSSELKLEPWMMVVIMIVVAVVIAFLAARATSKPVEKAPEPEPPKKVKKVKRKKAGSKSKVDEHHDRLERIERRIENLHDHVMEIHSNHDQVMGHFQHHLIRHHDVDEDELELKKDEGKLPPIDEHLEGGEKEEEATPEDRDIEKEMEPSPSSDADLEGPTESMSIGDEYGELRAPRACPRCGEKTEEDWVRCASCGYLLSSQQISQNR